MTPPLTLRPEHPQESVATSESTSTQIFGVLYITLTDLIDSMVPTSRPWAILGKSLSYIVKLAPILWWALPYGPAGCPPASSQEPTIGWIPDIYPNLLWYYLTYTTLPPLRRFALVAHLIAMSMVGIPVGSPLSEFNFEAFSIPLGNCSLIDGSLAASQTRSSTIPLGWASYRRTSL
ncbi:hypothetical protein DSO57_1002026 [Entomophthora muscae]|uniref:Uncharacterized protein n=1 Tax=Entomophthora muscae TaxID=34485 RepID=A0ACC2SB94_9FUNG|nr:hypothetical protein DSO57_1002026 [Entomophthora muscae]